MFYSQTDRTQSTAELVKRRWVVYLPTALMLLAAIASFIWFRLRHDTNGWICTALITILGGAYFVFFYEVYLKPVRQYKRHVDYMLDNRKRETVGLLQSISQDAQDHNGVDCRMVTLNVGEKDAPEDERTFYLDMLKTPPDIACGTRVRVTSNDRMVAALEPDVGKEAE
jgi:hypothetical protein